MATLQDMLDWIERKRQSELEKNPSAKKYYVTIFDLCVGLNISIEEAAHLFTQYITAISADNDKDNIA